MGATSSSGEAVRLRGHHLFCLHFYDGEGYSPEFVAELHENLAAAERDGVILVAGADTVCAACPHLAKGACEDEPEIDRLDRLARALLDAEPGAVMAWSDVRGRLPDLLDAWYVGACEDCSFLHVCAPAGLCDLCETAAEAHDVEAAPAR